MQLNLNNKQQRKRFNITFRETDKEEELYEWILEKSQINGVSAFFKAEMYKLMMEEKARNE